MAEPTSPPVVVLVRHPRPLVAPGVCYGRTDLPLHPEALAALDALAARVSRAGPGGVPLRVWTSPARRCTALAERIAARTGTEPRIDPRLAELDFGAWEGRAWDQVPRGELDRWAADPCGFAPPGGESGAALLARIRALHRDLVAARAPCAVVSHGGPLKLLSALLRGMPPALLAPAPPIGSIEVVPSIEPMVVPPAAPPAAPSIVPMS